MVDTVTEQTPAPARVRVLFEDSHTVAEKLKAAPGKWFKVSHGPKARYKVFLQTAYRIRSGRSRAFANPDVGMEWEARVVTQHEAENPDEVVEFYLRYTQVAAE